MMALRRYHTCSRTPFIRVVLAVLLISYTPTDGFVLRPKDLTLIHSTAPESVGRRTTSCPAVLQTHEGQRVTNRPFELGIVPPIFLSVLCSFTAAVVWITWEDCLCTNALPSRHVTLLAAAPKAWGQSTIHGMGFGKDERLFLLQQEQQLQQLAGTSFTATDHDKDNVQQYQQRSYNEVLLEHREDFVPRWTRKSISSADETQTAISTIVSSLQTVWTLQQAASDYQWTTIHETIGKAPLANLEVAASQLPRSETIGFDWGSCAWRHCGALADAQEALDELDYLLGVLEPYEAIFCLDIVERSLRDMLTAVPWDVAAAPDVEFYKNLPVYESKVRVMEESDDETSMIMQIDDAYFKALKDLRIED